MTVPSSFQMWEFHGKRVLKDDPSGVNLISACTNTEDSESLTQFTYQTYVFSLSHSNVQSIRRQQRLYPQRNFSLLQVSYPKLKPLQWLEFQHSFSIIHCWRSREKLIMYGSNDLDFQPFLHIHKILSLTHILWECRGTLEDWIAWTIHL